MYYEKHNTFFKSLGYDVLEQKNSRYNEQKKITLIYVCMYFICLSVQVKTTKKGGGAIEVEILLSVKKNVTPH